MSRVPDDGVYTIAHLRNALERDEWDIPQYCPEDGYGPEGNNFAVSPMVDREEREWQGVPVIGAKR
jgi:hypothetical protein